MSVCEARVEKCDFMKQDKVWSKNDLSGNPCPEAVNTNALWRVMFPLLYAQYCIGSPPSCGVDRILEIEWLRIIDGGWGNAQRTQHYEKAGFISCLEAHSECQGISLWGTGLKVVGLHSDSLFMWFGNVDLLYSLNIISLSLFLGGISDRKSIRRYSGAIRQHCSPTGVPSFLPSTREGPAQSSGRITHMALALLSQPCFECLLLPHPYSLFCFPFFSKVFLNAFLYARLFGNA